MWTEFMDMHSGGGQKENWPKIYIEAPEEQAIVIFYNRFGHNPHRVTCTCCGPDYSITETESLEEATAYERGCAWRDGKGYVEEPEGRSYSKKYQTLEQFINHGGCLIIPADKIEEHEKYGNVPEQGYIWQG